MSKRNLPKNWYRDRILDMYKGIEMVIQNLRGVEQALHFYMEMNDDVSKFKEFIKKKEEEHKKEEEKE